MTDQELLTPEEVAKMLRVHPQTLRRWRQDEDGPAYVRVSERVIRYRASDVTDWLNENWRAVDEARTDDF